METALDLIGDMRDDLYRSTAEISAAFFLQNGPVNLTGCDIGIFRQTFVDIDIRIEFLHRYFVATCFQKSSEGCGCDTLSQSGNNTSCYKYIFY